MPSAKAPTSGDGPCIVATIDSPTGMAPVFRDRGDLSRLGNCDAMRDATRRDVAAAGHVAAYYDARLAEYGDTPEGASWRDAHGRRVRFDVMLDVACAMVPEGELVLCDLGCGTGELCRRIRERRLRRVRYVGIDVSERALAHARAKFPAEAFARLDVLSASADELDVLDCDVLIADGVFTRKGDVTQDAMWDVLRGTVERVWPHVRAGIAFNVMSRIVDAERDELFHVGYDEMARFLHGLAGRSIGFRADYGLHEYTAYARKIAAYA